MFKEAMHVFPQCRGARGPARAKAKKNCQEP